MEPQFIDRFKQLIEIHNTNDTKHKQVRGIYFEKLINEIFEQEGSLRSAAFHTADNRSEQIDCAIEVWHRILLVEVKWVESNIAASELFSFIGKIENKFHGTLGLFISRNELTENFISALNRGRRQNVIVVHGEDLNLLFQTDSPSFTEYIEHCLKILSFDNKTHIPFRDFVKAYKAPTEIMQDNRNETSAFINKNLNKKDKVDEVELLTAYNYLKADHRESIFSYVLSNFDRIWLSQAKDYGSYLKYNYLNYFSLLTADSKEVSGTESEYFNVRLPSSFSIYGHPEILKLYLNRFHTLDLDVKVKFEERLVNELIDAGKYSNWEKENTITNIVEKLWSEFEFETKQKLKEQYIFIALDDFREDKFAQKKFAKKMLEQLISSEELQEWLLEKLRQFVVSVKDFSQMNNFFYSSYYKLAPYLNMETTDFIKYVDQKVEELYKKNY